MTTVVNLRYQEYDVDCTRPGYWGNPFRVGRDGTRDQVIAKHRAWFLSQPAMVLKAKLQLRGKRLGCICHPLSCHCDVLAEVADE